MPTTPDLIQARLTNHALAEPRFTSAAEAVRWFGAVQSQDYPGARWAVAQRMVGADDAALERAFNAGEILRTHVMRPTWHFVTPEDIGWMLALTAPRVNRALGTYNRKLGIDDDSFRRSHAAVRAALRGGNALTRAGLIDVLRAAGFDVEDQLRSTHLLMRAELDGLMCSGPMQGKQHTFMLLEERAPGATTLGREDALAELARRYFTSHGPATLKDYVWWSGLTAADARQGIALCGDALTEEVIDGVAHWSGVGQSIVEPGARVHLLPNYDEYIVGYADREALFAGRDLHALDPRGNVLFSHTIILDGRVAGTWRRTFKKGQALIEAKLLEQPSPDEAHAIDAALARFGAFLGMPAVLS